MSIFYICRKVTATQAGPTAAGSQVVQPYGQPNANTPSPIQQFTLDVKGIGEVTAAATLLGSNDRIAYERGDYAGMAWSLLATMETDAQSPASSALSTQNPFLYFGGYITAITGENAIADLILSA